MLSCYAVAMLLIVVVGSLLPRPGFTDSACPQYWLYILYLNKKKRVQLQEWEAKQKSGDAILEDWHDQTDIQNPRFVYTY
jgi:hypothetical protein